MAVGSNVRRRAPVYDTGDIWPFITAATGIKRVFLAQHAAAQPTNLHRSEFERDLDVQRPGPAARDGLAARKRAVLHAGLASQHPAGPGLVVHPATRTDRRWPPGAGAGQRNVTSSPARTAATRGCSACPSLKKSSCSERAKRSETAAVALFVIGTGELDAAAQRAQPHLEDDAPLPVAERPGPNAARFLDDCGLDALMARATWHGRRSASSRRATRAKSVERRPRRRVGHPPSRRPRAHRPP